MVDFIDVQGKLKFRRMKFRLTLRSKYPYKDELLTTITRERAIQDCGKDYRVLFKGELLAIITG